MNKRICAKKGSASFLGSVDRKGISTKVKLLSFYAEYYPYKTRPYESHRWWSTTEFSKFRLSSPYE